MRIFVDTNVLFDIIAQREPFFAASRKLLMMQAFGDAELWAAPQSYLDISYILGKTQPADRLQHSLATSLSRINLCTTSHEDVLSALQSGWNDAEDALIGISCRKSNADYLLTRDSKQQGFQHLGIPSYAPEDFFAMLESEFNITYEAVAM